MQRVLAAQESAPVVLWKIKTFRGANELFSSAFVSSFNQSPQVTVSATTYAAALSLQKPQIHCVAVCVCVCVCVCARACACCPISLTETMFLSAERRAWHMLPHGLKDHSASNVRVASDTSVVILGLHDIRAESEGRKWWITIIIVKGVVRIV